MQNYTKQNNTIQICCGPTLGTGQGQGESNHCLSDGVKLKDDVTV